MSKITGKKISNSVNDWLHVDNSNSGVDGTHRAVYSGNGNQSSMNIGNGGAKFQPVGSDNTNVLTVLKQDGTAIFNVDTTNQAIRGGVAGMSYMNTQFTTFAVRDLSPTAGTHYPMSYIPYFHDSSSSAITPQSIGTSTSPDTTLTIASNAHDWIHCIWVPHASLNIESIKVMLTADASVSVKFFISTYTINNSGATAGDLSAGSTVYSSATHAPQNHAIMQSSQSVDADVASGKAIIVSVENESSTDDISCVATLRWHLT